MLNAMVRRVLLAALALCAGLFASAAVAQPARTFVASTGTDANPCSVAAPCRTLQRGIDAVADGGDVLILDAGGFGSNVMITKSVSVFAPPGGQSRIAVNSGASGITVDGSDISVSLNGIGVSGSGADGIVFENGRSLSLNFLDVNISGGTIGVFNNANGASLTMNDTVLRNSSYICYFANGNGRSTINRSRAVGCAQGFLANPGSLVVIRSSQSIGGAECDYGFMANQSSDAVMVLDDIVAKNCTRGVLANMGVVVISNSQLSQNAFAGASLNGGIGRSYGNNRIFGNGSDTLTDFTLIAEQ